MSKLDGLDFRISTSPINRALSPVQAASGTKSSTHSAVQQLITAAYPKAEISEQLETRAELLRHSALNGGGSKALNQPAVNAYLSLQIHQEREEISKLIGINVYA